MSMETVDATKITQDLHAMIARIYTILLLKEYAMVSGKKRSSFIHVYWLNVINL